MSEQPIKMLFFPRETFPTDRVRLITLFGRELLPRGHEIDVVMQAADPKVQPGHHDWFGRSAWVGATEAGGGLVSQVRKNFSGIWHDLRWLWRARRDRYECVLVSDKYLLAALAAPLVRARGMKFMFWLTFAYHKAHVIMGREGTARHPALAKLRGYLTAFFLHRWIVPWSDHVFVQSETMAQDFCAHGADPRKLTPIVTGIDLAGITPPERAARPRQTVLTIAYLGTLVRERQLDALIDMLAELKKDGLIAKVLFIGDGVWPEDRRLIEDRADALGVRGQIEITGMLPRAQALSLACTADIGISPIFPSPIFDGASPTKLVEYMALGLPVIANSHPDQSLVLRESRAGVCTPWGARHFARAVRWLARRDAAELAAMGARGRAWVHAHRSYAGIADDFEKGCRRALLQR